MSSSVRLVETYVGLGANVGDAPSTLAAAVGALAALPGARLLGVSRLYRTRPVGVVDQPDFHNAVAALEVPAGGDPGTGALALLVALKELEAALGRRRRRRWGPREADLDLLVFGPHALRLARRRAVGSADQSDDARSWLEVPHPAARDRLFVLAPLADLAPELVPPGWGETVAEARTRREQVEGPDAVRAVRAWDGATRRWLPLGEREGASDAGRGLEPDPR